MSDKSTGRPEEGAEALDFRALAESLSHLVWSARADGLDDYCNARLLEYLGKSQKEMVGWNWLEIIHPDDRQRSADTWTAAVAAGTDFHIEYRLRGGDGLYRWFAGSAAPLRDAAGAIVRWVGTCTDIDERKRAEERLRASEAKLRLLHEGMQDAFVSVAMDGRILEFNQAYQKLVGYPAEELRALTYVDLTPERWHALEAQIVAEQVLPGGFSDVYEKEYRHNDGTLVPIELRTVLLRNAAGEPAGMWAIIRNISERKRLEQKLLESEERFRSLMDLSPDIVSIVANDGTLIYNSPAALAIHGYTQEEMVGRNTFDLIHPDDRSRCSAYSEQIFGNLPGPRSVQYRYRNKDGSYVWMEATASNQFANPHIRGLIVISRDISERMRGEEELAAARLDLEREHDVLKAVMTGARNFHLVYLDRDFNFVHVNETYARTCGYRPEEMIGKNHFALYPHAENETIFARVRDTGEAYAVNDRPFEFPDQPERGVTYWDWTLTPAKDAAGAVIGLVFSLFETTARKRAEIELEKAKEVAEAASRAKSEFLTNMSHEIRTPITGIMGMAELLEATGLSATQKHYQETILASSETLLKLVNDILDLAKIEAGMVVLERRRFSLCGVVREAVANQSPLAAAKGLVFRADISMEIPDWWYGDPLRLKQILLNLLGNAVKFTSRGSVTLSVAAEGREDELLDLSFAVTDTGIGISPAQLEEIFSPFRQADASISRKYGGTGLGLTICTRLAGLMGGRVWAESREGVGSTFHLRLPMAAAESRREGGEAQGDVLPLCQAADSLNVLLAEDDDASRLFFVEALHKQGHRVEVARNGAEALEKQAVADYDLILMDIQMPVMDGIEALRRIRAMEAAGRRRVPVVAVTAHAMDEDRRAFLAEGFDGYISKPARLKDLFDEVERYRPRRLATPDHLR